jgi:hypothetical protein
MKNLFKKNQRQNATTYQSARAFALDNSVKEGAMDGLLLRRIGKSRQEILDLMKILKTF